MVPAGRRRTIAFFIALGVGLISVILLLYIGWVLLNLPTGILFFLGVLLLAIGIAPDLAHQKKRVEHYAAQDWQRSNRFCPPGRPGNRKPNFTNVELAEVVEESVTRT